MSIRLLSDVLVCEASLFSVMESIDAMRFGSIETIQKKIENAVEAVQDLTYDNSVKLMGEFTNME